MAFEDELKSLIEPLGVTLGTTLFFGTGSEIPAGNGPFITVIVTAGPPAIRFQQAEYERPGAQIRVRGKVYATARNLAYTVNRALAGVRNRTVNGVWYREMYAVQVPFDDGLDDNKRIQFVFNVVAVKNPS